MVKSWNVKTCIIEAACISVTDTKQSDHFSFIRPASTIMNQTNTFNKPQHSLKIPFPFIFIQTPTAEWNQKDSEMRCEVRCQALSQQILKSVLSAHLNKSIRAVRPQSVFEWRGCLISPKITGRLGMPQAQFYDLGLIWYHYTTRK